jgi:hypothetical protein
LLIGGKSAIRNQQSEIKESRSDALRLFVFGMFVSGREAEDRSKMHQLFFGEKLFFSFAVIGVVHALINVNDIAQGALATGPTV